MYWLTIFLLVTNLLNYYGIPYEQGWTFGLNWLFGSVFRCSNIFVLSGINNWSLHKKNIMRETCSVSVFQFTWVLTKVYVFLSSHNPYHLHHVPSQGTKTNQEAKPTRTRRPFREHAIASCPRHSLLLPCVAAPWALPPARSGVTPRPRCPSSFNFLIWFSRYRPRGRSSRVLPWNDEMTCGGCHHCHRASGRGLELRGVFGWGNEEDKKCLWVEFLVFNFGARTGVAHVYFGLCPLCLNGM
jgi:ferredoxin